MLERVGAEEDDAAAGADGRRDDSVDTQDSTQGLAGLPDSPAVPFPSAAAAGDIDLPSTIPRRPGAAAAERDSSSSTAASSSKPVSVTDASTLPIRGIRSPPDAVHQLLAAGPADSVRDTAGKPVSNT